MVSKKRNHYFSYFYELVSYKKLEVKVKRDIITIVLFNNNIWFRQNKYELTLS